MIFSPEKREASQRSATCQIGEYETLSLKCTDVSRDNVQTSSYDSWQVVHMEMPVEVFNSPSALPKDPILRKQHLEDLMTKIHGSFTFMQVDFDCLQTHEHHINHAVQDGIKVASRSERALTSTWPLGEQRLRSHCCRPVDPALNVNKLVKYCFLCPLRGTREHTLIIHDIAVYKMQTAWCKMIIFTILPHHQYQSKPAFTFSGFYFLHCRSIMKTSEVWKNIHGFMS